jgi:hypothetical protein
MTPELKRTVSRNPRPGGPAASRAEVRRALRGLGRRGAATDQPADGRLCLAPRRNTPALCGDCQEKHETEEDDSVR